MAPVASTLAPMGTFPASQPSHSRCRAAVPSRADGRAPFSLGADGPGTPSLARGARGSGILPEQAPTRVTRGCCALYGKNTRNNPAVTQIVSRKVLHMLWLGFLLGTKSMSPSFSR